ncbi:hypothetical protein RMSM_01026 [Rhodopirellula maiorica SM1]|uniref:Uncharacterized protein n=1 Tax=Rhodopirellula maiorica SM1 TaxID=1265738 RepID=M5S776_9BACT|nr:hypothetical protein RMSM_01026 [Rhodopirellula maiorica SM1]
MFRRKLFVPKLQRVGWGLGQRSQCDTVQRAKDSQTIVTAIPSPQPASDASPLDENCELCLIRAAKKKCGNGGGPFAAIENVKLMFVN